MWIESHQELARHPKTKRLARMLDITVPAAIGHLHLLWWWALDYAQDGYLGNYTADDLADAMMWGGDPAILWEGLRSTHFLDDGEEGCEIHDWHQYGGRLAEKRKANIERVHRWRATKADVTHNECVRYTATEQNITEHNSKRETAAKSRPVTPPEDLQEFDSILRAVPAYSPTENYYQQVCKFRPTVDLCLEANKMVGWIKGQSKTKGTTAFVLSWLERANNEKHIPKIEPVPWVGKVYVQGN